METFSHYILHMVSSISQNYVITNPGIGQDSFYRDSVPGTHLGKHHDVYLFETHSHFRPWKAGFCFNHSTKIALSGF